MKNENKFIDFYNLTLETIENRRNINIKNITKYGIKILDDYLGGILPSELVVIGADTGVGKSELAFITAIENAKRGKKVCLFALEGDIQEISYRRIQREINKNNFCKTNEYRFNLNEKMYKIEEDIVTYMDNNLQENLFIFDKKNIPSLDELKKLITDEKDNFDLFIIDHIHYIDLQTQNENKALGEVMRELKTITDIIRKPIVLMSHLRKRSNKDEDPSSRDLYGSSNIAKEATTILLITKADKGFFGDNELDNNRYNGTKIILEKSRVGLPVPTSFMLIYDRYKKEYLEKYQQVDFENSRATEEDKLFN